MMRQMQVVWLLFMYLTLGALITNTTRSESQQLSFVSGIVKNDESTLFTDRMSRTARVITSISLLNSLSDGSAPVDNVIAELMNIGGADLKSLENIDIAKVDEFSNKVKQTKFSNQAKALENSLIEMSILKKAWISVGDLNNWPDDATYQQLGNDIANIDTSELTSIKMTEITGLLGRLNSLNDQELAELKTKLGKLSSGIEKTKQLVDYKKLTQTLERMQMFTAMADFLSIYANNPLQGKFHLEKNQEAVASDLSILSGLPSLESEELFKSIFAMTSDQSIYKVNQRSFDTSGFINGFKDLDKLSVDVKDQWMLQQIDPATKIGAVVSLVTMGKPMSNWREELDQLSTKGFHESATKVFGLHQQILSIQKPEESIGNVVEWATNCGSPDVNSASKNTIKSYSDIIKEVERKVNALTFLQSAEMSIAPSIESLSTGTSSDVVETLKQKLSNIEERLKLLADGKHLKDLDLKLADSSEVTEFFKNQDGTGIRTTFTCLTNENQEFEQWVVVAKLIGDIKDLQSNPAVLDDAKAAAEAISSSLSPLKSIRSMVEKIKRDKSDDREQLKGLIGLKNSTKTFGESVYAINMANTLIERSSEFESFVKDGNVFDANYPKQWGNFRDTVQRINTFFNGLKNWISEMKVSKDAKLSAYAEIFPKLQKIDDLNWDSEKRKKAIETVRGFNVAKNLNDQLDKFEATFKELSKLDVEFARFETPMKAMPKTIETVSTLLADSESSPNSESSESKPTRLKASQSTTSDPAATKSLVLVYIVVAVVILLVVLYVIGGCVSWFCYPKKYDRYYGWLTCCCPKNKNSKRKPISPTPPPRVEGKVDETKGDGKVSTAELNKTPVSTPAPVESPAQAQGQPPVQPPVQPPAPAQDQAQGQQPVPAQVQPPAPAQVPQQAQDQDQPNVPPRVPRQRQAPRPVQPAVPVQPAQPPEVFEDPNSAAFREDDLRQVRGEGPLRHVVALNDPGVPEPIVNVPDEELVVDDRGTMDEIENLRKCDSESGYEKLSGLGKTGGPGGSGGPGGGGGGGAGGAGAAGAARGAGAKKTK